MRLIRMTAVLLVVIAAGALATSAAAETLPEIGRCVAGTKRHSEYRDSKCTRLAKGKGNFNWAAGAVKKGFTAFGSEVALETKKLHLACGALKIDSENSAKEKTEWTGGKTAKVALVLVGCENTANEHSCQSNPAKTGEIEPLEAQPAELGFITGGAKPVVGLDIKAPAKTTPSWVTFTCGNAMEPPEFTATIEGSVIGSVKKIDTMVSEFAVAIKPSKAGTQVPEMFEGGAKDTLTLSVTKGVEKTSEAAVLTAPFALKPEEALEIKALTH